MALTPGHQYCPVDQTHSQTAPRSCKKRIVQVSLGTCQLFELYLSVLATLG